MSQEIKNIFLGYLGCLVKLGPRSAKYSNYFCKSFFIVYSITFANKKEGDLKKLYPLSKKFLDSAVLNTLSVKINICIPWTTYFAQSCTVIVML